MVKYITILILFVALGCQVVPDKEALNTKNEEVILFTIDSLIKASKDYYNSNTFSDSIFDKYLLQAEVLATNNHLLNEKISIYNIAGRRFRHEAEFGLAIMFFQKAHTIATLIDDNEAQAYALHNMAVAFRRIDDNGQALKLHFKVLEWAEMAADTFLVLASQNGIGNVNLSYQNYHQAIRYFQQSISILHNGYQNKLSEAINYNNIADCWLALENTDSAVYYLNKSYKVNLEIESTVGQAICENGLGNIAFFDKDYEGAIRHYKASLELNRAGKKNYYITENLKNLGKVYMQLNDYTLANNSFTEALQISESIGSKAQALEILKNLSDLHKKFGETKEALRFLDYALMQKDSITEEVVSQNVEGMKAIYKSEKQQREIALLKQKTSLDELLMKRQRALSIVAISLLIVLVFFTVYIFRQLKLKQHYSKTIEVQHKNITDSIKYAEKIQTAILPSFKPLSKKVDDYFVLFRPRNIVSGDFYWTTFQDNKTIVATADCTGHGVPGALMSMLGVSFLNEIVNNMGITAPNKILDELRIKLITQLHQKGASNSSRDGMEISIYTIEHDAMKLEYSGSYISLYLIRDKELSLLQADKMPVGYHWKKSNPFKLHTIDLQKGDCIYTSSDGYYDQFGGNNKKKFLIKKFKELLVQIHQDPMKDQKKLLDSTLDAWRGDFEQIDDIIVVGIRI